MTPPTWRAHDWPLPATCSAPATGTSPLTCSPPNRPTRPPPRCAPTSSSTGHWWRLDRAAEAQQAVTELAEDPSSSALAAFLDGQLRYTRALFGPRFGLDPDPDDASLAEQAFQQAAADQPLRGWARFWLGVLADNLHHDQASAADRYAQALQLACGDDDQLLISYVVRHQGFHLLGSDHQQAVAQLRRSLYLRAALAARPHTAAAQATLADALPAGAERDLLRDTATRLAGELGLSWLLAMLRDDPT